MALTLARDYGARVTGVTLSTEQLAAAQARADAEGLADRVSFQLLDYRAADQSFDRIVSVGMFEHVGVFHYRTFFDTVSRCLKPDGVALLHSIGQWDGPGINNPWISKYIFPGAYCPALSEVMPAIEDSGLLTTDVEVLRLHYAETLRHWRLRSCLPVLLSLLGADWRVFWLYSNPPRSVATNEPTGFYKSPKHISASHDVVCAMAAASPLHGVGGNVTFTAGRETISKFKRAFVAVPISAA